MSATANIGTTFGTPGKPLVREAPAADGFGLPSAVSRTVSSEPARREGSLILAECGWTLGRIAAHWNVSPAQIADWLLMTPALWRVPNREETGLQPVKKRTKGYLLKSGAAMRLLIGIYRGTGGDAEFALPADARRKYQAQLKILQREGLITARPRAGDVGRRSGAAYRLTARGEAAALLWRGD